MPERHFVKYTFLKVDPAWRRLDVEERRRDKREFVAACEDFAQIEGHLLADERQRIMTEHIRMGREYPSIDLNTSYSFGLDDQEFVVAFETDDPADFLDLVQRLRTTESSSYTLRDTPVFTCIAASVERALGALDGDALTSGIDPLVTTPIT